MKKIRKWPKLIKVSDRFFLGKLWHFPEYWGKHVPSPYKVYWSKYFWTFWVLVLEVLNLEVHFTNTKLPMKVCLCKHYNTMANTAGPKKFSNSCNKMAVKFPKRTIWDQYTSTMKSLISNSANLRPVSTTHSTMHGYSECTLHRYHNITFWYCSCS
jgi:hypothetical protein